LNPAARSRGEEGRLKNNPCKATPRAEHNEWIHKAKRGRGLNEEEMLMKMEPVLKNDAEKLGQ